MDKLIEKQYKGNTVYLRDNIFDISIYEALISSEEYGYIEYINEPKVIIDAGGNIGLSAIYFANRFPNAKIISIEPASDNIEILKKNVEPYKNISVEFCALMSSDGWGAIIDSGSTLGYQVEKSEENDGVACKSIASICREYSIDYIDMFKFDIEGAEKAIFEGDLDWLNKTGSIVIELHERYAEGCNKVFFDATNNMFKYQWIGGENIYLSKEGIAYPSLPNMYKTENPATTPTELYNDARTKFDLDFTEMCSKKDEEIAKFGEEAKKAYKELEEKSAEFDVICHEKDEQLAKICTQKDEELSKIIAQKDEQLTKVCEQKDAELAKICEQKDAELQKLASIIEENNANFANICAEKDAEIERLRS